MKEIETEDEFSQKKSESALMLAYFSTPTCNVCKSLRPQVAQLIREYDVEGIYVDTETFPSVSGQLLVFAVPTMVLFVYGKEFGRFGRHLSMGELAASIERVKKIIE